FQVTNGSASNVVTRSVEVRAVNTAPVLTLPATAPTTARTVAGAIDGLGVADVDAGGGPVRITLRVTRGTIGFADLGSVTVSEGENNSPLIALGGTLAALNTLLAG